MDIREVTVEDCDDLGLIMVTASHSAFIGAIPEEHLDFSWTPAVSAENWRKGFSDVTDRGQDFLVATEGDRAIGYIWTKPWADTEDYDGSVQGLYVLPTWQRRGVGKRLLEFGVQRLRDANIGSLEIGCVKENPSCDFYRHLGGIEIGRRPVRVDRFETEEILFGWQDLSILV